jgi:small conductance mechanosensitive channel
LDSTSLVYESIITQIDLPMIFSIALITIVSIVIYYAVTRLITTTAQRTKIQPEKVDAIINIVKIVIGSLAAIMILGTLNIDITGLIAGVGIGAIAIGFAAQTLISNFISGLLLFFEDVFDHGDYIQVGDVIGRVVKMSFRTTQLATIDGNIVTLPNNLLASNQLINLTDGKPEILLTIRETIDIYANAQQAKRLMLEALTDINGVIMNDDHKPVITLDQESGLWSTTLTLYVTAVSTNWHLTQSQIKETIKHKFKAACILPPVPAFARIRIPDIQKELNQLQE